MYSGWFFHSLHKVASYERSGQVEKKKKKFNPPNSSRPSDVPSSHTPVDCPCKGSTLPHSPEKMYSGHSGGCIDSNQHVSPTFIEKS